MSNINKRLRAFQFAFSGLRQAFVKEAHIKIHTACAILAFSAGIYFSISAIEWFALFLAVVLVFVSELFNTAIEKLCDLTHPAMHPTIKYIKDISASAVLLAAAFAIITACIVFWPHICSLNNKA